MVKQITMTNLSLLLLLLPFFALLHPSSQSRTGPASFYYRPASSSSLKSFNVLDYGAKGDGKTKSTKSFLRAWKDACSSSGEVQLYVPKGNYVLSSLRFDGDCKTSNIVFRIDGTLVASVNDKSFSWIAFHRVNGLHIMGGALDANGKPVWDCKEAHNSHKECPMGAMSLSFDNSENIVVEGLTSYDSQMFHVTINACQNLNIVGMTIRAAPNSPNTDGLHMEGSTGVTIMHSNFQTGDDCISIGPNNQNIWIEDVHCGPGHGISIGSLGKHGSGDNVEVKNVTVKSTIFTDTTNGLRIKTWATPIKGLVHDIFFLGAQMNNVQNPIIIDQNYCPASNCPSGQASGMKMENIIYKGIRGTSSSEVAMTFNCSPKTACEGITLQDIQLSHVLNSKTAVSECKHAYGKSIGPIQPSSCLR